MDNGWRLVVESIEDLFLSHTKRQKEVEIRCDYYCILFDNLLDRLQPWFNATNTDGKIRIIQAVFLLKKPISFETEIEEIYEQSFKLYSSLRKELFAEEDEITDEMDDGTCSACTQDRHRCRCTETLSLYTRLAHSLSQLGLIEHVVNPALETIVYNQLSKFIETKCKGEFFEPCLEKALHWSEQGLFHWLRFSTEQDKCKKNLEIWKPRINFFVYKAFAELRISEMFEIIVEYPDSSPAICDMKECLERTQTRQLLTESLKEAFASRLLHPAVNTDDILTQYVSAIQALRQVDPAGVILDNVCHPLREYLKSRDDTIKCIITCITDEESGPDLVDELINDSITHDDESDGESWMPDPVDAKTDLSSKKERTADIINILVNIYGSRDLFVSQYRVLLADRLLSNYSYDVTTERRYLELLKKRFGENQLHFCDIMLKDVQDSQRINRTIKDQMKEKDQEIDFSAFILSSAFWPTLSGDNIEPSTYVKSLMDTYTEGYKQLKGSRTLDWLQHLGSVELEVQLAEETKTFNATPSQASFLLAFQEKEEWTLTELSQETGVTKNSLRSRIAFWVSQGVIIEKPNSVYISAQTFQSQAQDTTIYESDEESNGASNQRDEELQVYWSYIVGMLSNLGTLPLERIHAMLKMFATHGESAQCSLEEVKEFLKSKVNEGDLLFVGGAYKLPKSN